MAHTIICVTETQHELLTAIAQKLLTAPREKGIIKMEIDTQPYTYQQFADLKKNPHPQHDKYAKPLNFKKFTIRCGNLIWGKHADMSFPAQALYNADLEYCE